MEMHTVSKDDPSTIVGTNYEGGPQNPKPFTLIKWAQVQRGVQLIAALQFSHATATVSFSLTPAPVSWWSSIKYKFIFHHIL